MARQSLVPDIVLVFGSTAVAAFVALSVKPFAGRYVTAIVFLASLFLLLWYAAVIRGWNAPSVIPVARTQILSEVFLGLFLFVAALAISWYAGLAIGRAFTDEDGVLSGLVIFGALMLAISAWRDWQ